jgi:hypothetical protein
MSAVTLTGIPACQPSEVETILGTSPARLTPRERQALRLALFDWRSRLCVGRPSPQTVEIIVRHTRIVQFP